MENAQASGNPVHEGEAKLSNSREERVMENTNHNHRETDPETPPPEYDLWKINYKKLVKLLIKVIDTGFQSVSTVLILMRYLHES